MEQLDSVTRSTLQGNVMLRFNVVSDCYIRLVQCTCKKS